MEIQFKKAVRQQAKLRLALSGPSGSGKSWGALKIAKGMGGRIAVIDTERGSASLYSHLVDFDTLELNPPFEPEKFIAALHAAEKAGYDIVILDSITHEWNGSGGCLEINDRLAAAKYKGNTWAAWNETTPRHRKFVDAILQSPAHIIATIRAKTDTVQEGGKVKKVGMKDEQRDGNEYEYTTVLNIIHDGHYATGAKDRTGLFIEPHVISEETGIRLRKWLESGAPLKVETPPAPKLDPVLFGQMMKFMESTRDVGELIPHWQAFHLSREKFTPAQYAEGEALKNNLKAKFAAAEAAVKDAAKAATNATIRTIPETTATGDPANAERLAKCRTWIAANIANFDADAFPEKVVKFLDDKFTEFATYTPGALERAILAALPDSARVGELLPAELATARKAVTDFAATLVAKGAAA